MRQQVKRSLILKLHFEGKPTKEIMQTASATKWCVYRKIKRYKETGTIVDKPRSGRPRTAQTANMKKIGLERVRRNPARSIRKMAKELKVNGETN